MDLFRIEACMYKPFSVKALGTQPDLGEIFAVGNFDRKVINFYLSNINNSLS